ncbi:hypothetical protein GPA19_08500 [Azoarcus indigens]|uniref:hypothetical protein n=1 Tax=Azoarcus indigens TaxID=29545 RepID=UPI00105F0CD9|nr:hypothetical protein [Azoarcus indigens]NMG64984.1 hypothetical protein [Azoarcus indigens]
MKNHKTSKPLTRAALFLLSHKYAIDISLLIIGALLAASLSALHQDLASIQRGFIISMSLFTGITAVGLIAKKSAKIPAATPQKNEKEILLKRIHQTQNPTSSELIYILCTILLTTLFGNISAFGIIMIIGGR